MYQVVTSHSNNRNDKNSDYYDEHVIARLSNRQELANLVRSFTTLEHCPAKLFPLCTGLLRRTP